MKYPVEGICAKCLDRALLIESPYFDNLVCRGCHEDEKLILERQDRYEGYDRNPRTKYTPCRCSAYKWPHRPNGGKCGKIIKKVEVREEDYDSLEPPWWCGRCDGSSCSSCSGNRRAYNRELRDSYDRNPSYYIDPSEVDAEDDHYSRAVIEDLVNHIYREGLSNYQLTQAVRRGIQVYAHTADFEQAKQAALMSVRSNPDYICPVCGKPSYFGESNNPHGCASWDFHKEAYFDWQDGRRVCKVCGEAKKHKGSCPGPKKNPTYYHGTRQEYLDKIEKDGLVYPFLASEPAEAYCWGCNYANSPDDVRVLEVELDDADEDRIVPDYNLMDVHERAKVLGVEPEDYYDVRSEMLGNEKQLIDAARRAGISSVDDRECGGEASIFLGDIPPSKLRQVDRYGRALIENPSPDRDAKFRQEAKEKYQQLIDWLEQQSSIYHNVESVSFGRSANGPFQTGLVLPWYFVDREANNWKHPLRHFNVVFFGEPNEKRAGSFVTLKERRGNKEYDKHHVFLYHALDKPGQLDGLLSRLKNKETRSTFIHEYVHFLDALRRKGVIKHISSETANIKDYFLSPAEYNAFYLQGFENLEREFSEKMVKFTPESLVAWLKRSHSMGILVDSGIKIERSLGEAGHLLVWDNIRFNLVAYWHHDFIKALRSEPSMWKRFLKRLAVDYEAWRQPHSVAIWNMEEILYRTVNELTGKSLLELRYEDKAA